MKTFKIIVATTFSALFLCIAPVHAYNIFVPMADTVNSGIINSKMLASDNLNGAHVDATVVNGVAIFKGHVMSEKQKRELIIIARSVSGIKAVDVSGIKTP